MNMTPFFWRDFCTKFDPLNDFLNSARYIILKPSQGLYKSESIRIFFNYWGVRL